tara:strand:+ start:181 stop:549 length:369 start_codon:yes stop_codon:yes gene_type:complete
MATYTIYKTDTGDIDSCGSTNVPINVISLETNQSIIEGIFEAEKYKIIDGIAVEQTIDIWIEVRLKRNALLLESDWTQIQDAPLTDAIKSKWKNYRQLLRDLPNSNKDALKIENINFPNKPK